MHSGGTGSLSRILPLYNGALHTLAKRGVWPCVLAPLYPSRISRRVRAKFGVRVGLAPDRNYFTPIYAGSSYHADYAADSWRSFANNVDLFGLLRPSDLWSGHTVITARIL
jgi:hypothetical protein